MYWPPRQTVNFTLYSQCKSFHVYVYLTAFCLLTRILSTFSFNFLWRFVFFFYYHDYSYNFESYALQLISHMLHEFMKNIPHFMFFCFIFHLLILYFVCDCHNNYFPSNVMYCIVLFLYFVWGKKGVFKNVPLLCFFTALLLVSYFGAFCVRPSWRKAFK